MLDDEDPQVRVEFDPVPNAVVEEGGNGISFTVRLSKDPERTITIPIRVAHHDGASSSDYTLSVDGVAGDQRDVQQRGAVEADHADRGGRR